MGSRRDSRQRRLEVTCFRPAAAAKATDELTDTARLPHLQSLRLLIRADDFKSRITSIRWREPCPEFRFEGAGIWGQAVARCESRRRQTLERRVVGWPSDRA